MPPRVQNIDTNPRSHSTVYTHPIKKEENLSPLSFFHLHLPAAMGQVWTTLQNKFQGKEWREKQIRRIIDHVFDTIRDSSKHSRVHKDKLAFEELYIAVLHVYNEINKKLPGPHCDPPTEEKLMATIQEYDVNLDGLLDREEFAMFIKKITSDTLQMVSRNLIIALVVAPTTAMLSKRATENVPGVGKAVQKIPTSVYATIVTLAVVWFQTSGNDIE